MPIPAFDERGNLPPGIHEATWADLVSHFGSGAARQALLTGLGRALEVLASAGCRRVWLAGSFVSDVEAREGRPPGDVDVCWDLEGVDVARLASLAPELHPLLGETGARRRRFGGDYFPVVEPLALGQLEAFQFDRDGERKGIVLLVLEGGGR